MTASNKLEGEKPWQVGVGAHGGDIYIVFSSRFPILIYFLGKKEDKLNNSLISLPAGHLAT